MALASTFEVIQTERGNPIFASKFCQFYDLMPDKMIGFRLGEMSSRKILKLDMNDAHPATRRRGNLALRAGIESTPPIGAMLGVA